MAGTWGHRICVSAGFLVGVAVVVSAFSAIELWSSLYHDPFLPNARVQAWTVLHFNLYGATFIGCTGALACFLVSGLFASKANRPSRTTLLGFALLGAVVYMLLHHSRHVLGYWESGGTW